MSSTFRIIQENCTGCGRCVPVSNDEIALNDNGVAYFVSTGEDTANFGTDTARYIFAAIEECPSDCIEEMG